MWFQLPLRDSRLHPRGEEVQEGRFNSLSGILDVPLPLLLVDSLVSTPSPGFTPPSRTSRSRRSAGFNSLSGILRWD